MNVDDTKARGESAQVDAAVVAAWTPDERRIAEQIAGELRERLGAAPDVATIVRAYDLLVCTSGPGDVIAEYAPCYVLPLRLVPAATPIPGEDGEPDERLVMVLRASLRVPDDTEPAARYAIAYHTMRERAPQLFGVARSNEQCIARVRSVLAMWGAR